MIHRSQFSLQDVPARPGVYVFRNSGGDVIYVGKAKSLRKRLASYFQASRKRTADVKLRALIKSIEYVEAFPVPTEAEAYLLESRLIKQYCPRYNVELRDDKRFLLIAVDPGEPYPRLRLTRMKKDDGRMYFGPFPRAAALRQTVAYLARTFRLRTCGVREPNQRTHRHCLERAVRSCSCPCIGKVTPEQYQEQLDAAIRVLKGDSTAIEEQLNQDMTEQARKQRFEDAARIRDILENIRYVCRAEKLRSYERATLRTPEPADGVRELQDALGMEQPPAIIECFDISNISGRMAVASMVCFRNGRPSTRDYRRFRIRSVDGADDVAMMREAVARRYRRLVDEQRPLPDLVVIDGGAGQLSAALAALRDEGIPPLPVLGLAKRREEIFLPGRSAPLTLPRQHAGLKVLQAIRDEAHRFALGYHHTLRRRRISDSVLAEIDGIGPKRQQSLLKAFGSVARLRQASADEIAAAVPGLGKALAKQVKAYIEKTRVTTSAYFGDRGRDNE